MDGGLGEWAEVPGGSAVVAAQRLAPVQPGQRAVQQRGAAHLAPCSEKAQRKHPLQSLCHPGKPTPGRVAGLYPLLPSFPKGSGCGREQTKLYPMLPIPFKNSNLKAAIRRRWQPRCCSGPRLRVGTPPSRDASPGTRDLVSPAFLSPFSRQSHADLEAKILREIAKPRLQKSFFFS